MRIADYFPDPAMEGFRQLKNHNQRRIWAGDQSLHAEVAANAASDGTVNQLAREALAREAGAGDAGDEAMVVDDGADVGDSVVRLRNGLLVPVKACNSAEFFVTVVTEDERRTVGSLMTQGLKRKLELTHAADEKEGIAKIAEIEQSSAARLAAIKRESDAGDLEFDAKKEEMQVRIMKAKSETAEHQVRLNDAMYAADESEKRMEEQDLISFQKTVAVILEDACDDVVAIEMIIDAGVRYNIRAYQDNKSAARRDAKGRVARHRAAQAEAEKKKKKKGVKVATVGKGSRCENLDSDIGK